MTEDIDTRLGRICVFCGAKTGRQTSYAQAAGALGRGLADRGIGLVFGGGSVGLMGVLADAALAGGGEVIGVIPGRLATEELLHPAVADMRVVDDMHQRKALMQELSDAFIAMPGGFGTYEELFEVLAWVQLGYHAKPVGLLDTAGYFGPLAELLDHAVDEGFLDDRDRGRLIVCDDPVELLDALVASDRC